MPALGRRPAALSTRAEPGRARCWSHEPATAAPAARAGRRRRRRRRPAGLGRAAAGLAAAPAAAGTGRPVPLAPSRPADAGLGPVPAAASPLRAAAAAALQRGRWSTRCCSTCPPCRQPGGAAARRLPRRGGRTAGARRRGPGRARPPGPGAAVRAGRPGGAAADRAGRRRVVVGMVDRLAVLPDAVCSPTTRPTAPPPGTPEARRCSTCARWRPIARCCGRVSPAARCAAAWCGRARAAVMPLPDALLDGYAPGSLDRAAARPTVQVQPAAVRRVSP